MSKKRILIALIVLFNILIVLGFFFSNLYVSNFLETQIDQGVAYNGHGTYVIPYVEDFGWHLSISHPIYVNGTIANLGPLPMEIPNYPFILFWVAIVGNLLFIFVLLIKQETEKSVRQTSHSSETRKRVATPNVTLPLNSKSGTEQRTVSIATY